MNRVNFKIISPRGAVLSTAINAAHIMEVQVYADEYDLKGTIMIAYHTKVTMIDGREYIIDHPTKRVQDDVLNYLTS